MKLTILILVFTLMLGFSITPVFAESITISTDQSTLTHPFEQFIIRGTVDSAQNIRDIKITIYDPDGQIVYSPTVPLRSGGEFFNVATVYSTWEKDGTYTIEASHSKLTQKATTQVQLQIGPSPIISSSHVTISGFKVTHNLGGGVQSAVANPDSKTITFTLSGQNAKNTLDIDLPIGLIENPNTVWVDGNKISFESSTTGDITNLKIPIRADSSKVEILGSFVVPEFGAISAIILAISIVTVLVITTKIRNFSIPKY